MTSKKERKTYNRKYQKSKKGKLAHSKAVKKYRQTEKGKKADKRINMGAARRRRQLRQKIYLDQNGCCDICGKSIPLQWAYLDHNHETGKIRRILCVRCNIFVGFVETSPELVDKIFEYLKNN